MRKSAKVIRRHYIYERCCEAKDCTRNAFAEQYIKYWEEAHPFKGKTTIKRVKDKVEMEKATTEAFGKFVWCGVIDASGTPHVVDMLVVDEYDDGFTTILVPTPCDTVKAKENDDRMYA